MSGDPATPRSASLRLTGDHVAQMGRILGENFTEQARLRFVLLATIDGRVVTKHSRQDVDTVKFAALTSTIMSMSAAAVRELGGTSPDECLLTYDKGSACMGKCGPSGRLVLCHVAGSDLSMGLLVSGWRRTAAALTAAFP